MSKNLEMEYRTQIQNDVPDLWDRIEAGLEEKKPENQNTKIVNYSKRKRFYTIGGGILAAGLCIAVGLPVFFGTMSSESEMATAEMAAADCATTTTNSVDGAMQSEYAETKGNVMMDEVMLESASEENIAVCVKIMSILEEDDFVEYEAMILAEIDETEQLELAMTIKLRESEEAGKFNLELMQEYTVYIQETEAEYYLIQDMEK